MRNRWLHVPELHSRLDGYTKKVSWLELFYDLAFVAAFIQLGETLMHDVSAHGFVLFAAHFLPLWVTWAGYTFFANRFDLDDAAHRALVFGKIACVGWMAVASSEAMEGEPGAFAAGFAGAQLLLAVMHLRVSLAVERARKYSRFWAVVSALTAGLWAVSILIPAPTCYLVWGGSLLLPLLAPLAAPSRALSEDHPADFEHLSERFGLLMIIVLGESFVEIIAYLVAHDGAHALHALFNVSLAFAVWWTYFDDVAGSELSRRKGAGTLWFYAHLPLTFGITALAVASARAIEFNAAEVAPQADAWLLSASVALVMFSVAVIDAVSKRATAQFSDLARINTRVVAGVLVLLLAQVASSMSGATFLGLVAALLLLQIVFDLLAAPYAEAHSEAEGGRVRAADAVELPEVHLATRRTLVRGAPSGLRRDLYFYFVEGSWMQLLLTFGAAFVLINVAFAGLYLLDPTSFSGGDGTLGDAFEFSIETLSTIGYGTMTPSSSYGRLVVTIEAAAGMLFVALATGVAVAKASRPRTGILFSQCAVVYERDGQRTLALRVGNTRANEIVDAKATLTALFDEQTQEGEPMCRLASLELVRERTPMFDLSWTIMHRLDANSPLRDVDWTTAEGKLLGLVVTLEGHDNSYDRTTYCRHVYTPKEIRPEARFVDVVSTLPDGRFIIDYTHFHETEPAK